MKKEIKKYGNAIVIRLNPEEQKVYDLREGDIIDIQIKKEVKK